MNEEIENTPVPPPKVGIPSLLIMGSKFEIHRDLVIGRAPNCDIVLPDNGPKGPYIGSHHAKIHCRKNQCWLEDLKSVNGTYMVTTDAYGTTQYKKLPPNTPTLLSSNDRFALCYHPALGPYVEVKFED